jgi:hypothetical protein
MWLIQRIFGCFFFRKHMKEAAEALDSASPEFKEALLDFEKNRQELIKMQQEHKAIRHVAKGGK